VLQKNTGTDGGWYVKCDGCGKEILAQVFEDRVVVVDRRHGTRHIAVIPRCDLLKIMGACSSSSNIKSECNQSVVTWEDVIRTIE
jgi:hypothetical protein